LANRGEREKMPVDIMLSINIRVDEGDMGDRRVPKHQVENDYPTAADPNLDDVHVIDGGE